MPPTADPDHKKWEYKLISDDNIHLGNTCKYTLGTAHKVSEDKHGGRFRYSAVRQRIIDAMKTDLMGPLMEEEVLDENPRHAYVTWSACTSKQICPKAQRTTHLSRK